jgi:hypothetical protein
MTRDEILQDALRVHDAAGCRCDRKYVMCCTNLVLAILDTNNRINSDNRSEGAPLVRSDLDQTSRRVDP